MLILQKSSDWTGHPLPVTGTVVSGHVHSAIREHAVYRKHFFALPLIANQQVFGLDKQLYFLAWVSFICLWLALR